MNNAAFKENARSLADLLGTHEEEAAQLLDATVVLTIADNDQRARATGEHVELMLSRTLTRVCREVPGDRSPGLEIVIGETARRYAGHVVYISFQCGRVVVGERVVSDRLSVAPIALLLAACYTCAAGLKRILGDRLRQPVSANHVVDLEQLLGEDACGIEQPVDFGEAFLAGGGAIGNGFVLGAALLPLSGKLHIADDDKASGGNLQRCVLFDETDINHPKAQQLAKKGLALSQGRLRCEGHNVVLQNVPQRTEGGWLWRLIVAVDSPRARRQLQTELPREVFDASTTGAEEVVLHFNEQPTADACLACVYHHSPPEAARENHIAETLGVTVAEVRELRVSPASTSKICSRYAHLRPEDVVGLAYDTLFKALCSTSKLMTPENRQVLTPFAFVSVFAGAMLALEFFRRVRRGSHANLYNTWHMSPWTNPVLRARRQLKPKADCQFCSDPIVRAIVADTWRNSSAKPVCHAA